MRGRQPMQPGRRTMPEVACSRNRFRLRCLLCRAIKRAGSGLAHYEVDKAFSSAPPVSLPRHERGNMNDGMILKSVVEIEALSRTLAPSRLLPEALQKSPADVMLILMTGAELGLTPMASIRGIHVIKGKPTLSAELMAAVVRGSPNCERLECIETSGTTATWESKRKGALKPMRITFTLDDAKAAGLLAKDVWRQYPAAMLRARALKALLTVDWQDEILGLTTPEEVESYDAQPPPIVAQRARLVLDAPVSAPVVEVELKESVDEATGEVAVEASTSALGRMLFAIDAAANIGELNACAAKMSTLAGEERDRAVAAYNQKRLSMRKLRVTS